MDKSMREFKIQPFVKYVVLKIGLFESEIIDEANFGIDENLILCSLRENTTEGMIVLLWKLRCNVWIRGDKWKKTTISPVKINFPRQTAKNFVLYTISTGAKVLYTITMIKYDYQKSLPQWLQCHCLLFLPMLNIPNTAVWAAFDVLVIFFILVAWQYGHSIPNLLPLFFPPRTALPCSILALNSTEFFANISSLCSKRY